MKKRLRIFLIILFCGVVLVVTLLSVGKKAITIDAQTTNVVLRDYQPVYQTVGSVKATEHHHFIVGTIINLMVAKGETVKVGTVLAVYQDGYGKKKKLTSQYTGVVTSIDVQEIIVTGNDYYIQAAFPMDIADQLQINDQALFTSRKPYEANVTAISNQITIEDGSSRLNVSFKLSASEGLRLGQRGLVKVFLPVSHQVTVVAKAAVIEDENGPLLVLADWLNDIDNVDRYKLKVKIVQADDDWVVVEGIGLQNQAVIIWDESLKQLWQLN